MKIKITLKDPDGVADSLDDAVIASIPSAITDKEERSALYELRREKIIDDVKEWISWNEYVSIEIDTDAGTATVLKARD